MLEARQLAYHPGPDMSLHQQQQQQQEGRGKEVSESMGARWIITTMMIAIIRCLTGWMAALSQRCEETNTAALDIHGKRAEWTEARRGPVRRGPVGVPPTDAASDVDERTIFASFMRPTSSSGTRSPETAAVYFDK